MRAITKDYLRSYGTAAHTRAALTAAGAGSTEMIAEIFKGFAIPGFENSIAADIVSPTKLLIIKGAGESLHITGDIHRPTTALAGIYTVKIDISSVVKNGGNGAGIKANLEIKIHGIDQLEKFCHTGVICAENICFRTETDWLMQKENDGVNTLGEIVISQTLYSFVDGIIAENIVDIGFYTGIEKHLDSLNSMRLTIPADSNCTTIFLAELNYLIGKTETGAGEVGDNAVFAAILKDFLEVFVLVYVAATAKSKLIDPALALVNDTLEIFEGHIGDFGFKSVLITLNAGLDTQAACAMNAMPHDTHIDKSGERAHKGVNACIFALFVDYAAAHIKARLRVEHFCKSILLVEAFNHFVIVTPFLKD